MQTEETESRPFGGWRELLRVAWPLIINSGTFAVLNFSDRLFLSWYGEAEFRASLPSGILFFTLVCGFMAPAGFVNTFVAQYWGAGDKQGCVHATAQGILFSLCLCISWRGLCQLDLDPVIYRHSRGWFYSALPVESLEKHRAA